MGYNFVCSGSARVGANGVEFFITAEPDDMAEEIDTNSEWGGDVVVAEVSPVGSVSSLEHTEVVRAFLCEAEVEDRFLSGGSEGLRVLDRVTMS